MSDRKMSHVDVLTRGMEQGLSYEDAEALAFHLCPEYRMCSTARYVNAINRILS
jgi:hypothetical protein